jgi:mannose-6-phosphate isomerase-like protein (cupin superfamily)
MTTTEATQKKALVLQAGEGQAYDPFGNKMLVRVPREATDNQLWLADYVAEPHFDGPPPHVHRRTHEVFYVLEGELGVLAGEEEHIVGAGGLMMVPPGVRHTFFNRSDAPCRFVGITTPGDLGAYLEALPGVIQKYGFPPPADVTAALAEEYDGGILSIAP